MQQISIYEQTKTHQIYFALLEDSLNLAHSQNQLNIFSFKSYLFCNFKFNCKVGVMCLCVYDLRFVFKKY